MATVPHVTSGSELRKFLADGFLLDRVYVCGNVGMWLKGQQGCSRLCTNVCHPRTTDVIRHSDGFLNVDEHLLYEVKLCERLCLSVLTEVI